MREIVQVVAWYALVMAIGIGLIWGVDNALGIRHINVGGAAVGSGVVVLHTMPYMLLGGALTWLQHKIFGR